MNPWNPADAYPQCKCVYNVNFFIFRIHLIGLELGLDDGDVKGAEDLQEDLLTQERVHLDTYQYQHHAELHTLL